MHSVIRRSPSAASSTVADPSTVTVRIESASTSDLNVQDVSTPSTSSSSDEQSYHRNPGNRSSMSRHRRRHTSAILNSSNATHQQRPSRLRADTANTIRIPQNRPITAVSLPAKPTAYDNEWDLDMVRPVSSSIQRRNPSCPLISPSNIRSKPPSSPVPPTFTHQLVPPVFTTTSECLGREYHPQPRRDVPRRSQSLAKTSGAMSLINTASPTAPMVFLTDDILLGSIRALQNERQLCKLSIDYLVDATNMRPDELARKANVGARLPCHCGHTHSRCTLTLEFNQSIYRTTTTTTTTNLTIDNNSTNRDISRAELSQLFSVVNRFVHKALQENKRALIYGFELTPNSPLAVIAIQYLMLSADQLSLAEATHTVHRLFPSITIQQQQNLQYPTMERRFVDYLRQLDRKTFPRNFIINSSGSGITGGIERDDYSDRRESRRDHSLESPETTTTNSETTVTSWTALPMPIANNSSSSHHLFAARPAWDS